MKLKNILATRAALLALVAGSLTVNSSRASSYASSLTNSAGTVSFRLNEAADNVKVIGNGGSLTNNLGAVARGLTVTNLTTSGMTGGVFQVVVSKVGSGVMSLIGASVPFNSPRGVAVNMNPASPRFGRVYVANSAAGSKGDGMFLFGADLSDTFNQGTVARTGGIDVTTGTTSSPYRLKVGHDDDNLYITDFSDATGNLYMTDPDVTNSSFIYALKRLSRNFAGNQSAALPLGTNTHGSTEAVEVTGSLAAGNLKIYTLDEDLQSDPTTLVYTEGNSLWEYDVNSGPLPWSNAPNAKLFTPTIGFASQTMDLARGTNGYFYITDLRSSGNEAGLFVLDSTGAVLFNSRTESLAEGFSVDQLANSQGVAVSEDGQYVAIVRIDNLITILPLTNGIPNFPARFTSSTLLGTTGNGRGIAFDKADNVYVVSSGLAILQSLSLGFTATNTTGSDGLFTATTPSTQVYAVLMDPDTTVVNTLSEADLGTVATFNIVRTNDDFSGPLGVNFSLAGTATRGTNISSGDYVIKTNGVVITNETTIFIPAGSSNVVLTIAPNDDTIPELTETIIFALSGGAYNVITPSGNTISLTDNETPMVDLSAIVFTNAFEGNTNDFIRYRLTRRGDVNAASFDVNLNYAGTATRDVDYASLASVTIDSGAVTKTFDIHPLDDALLENNETVAVSVAPGTGYLVGTNSATTTNAVGIIISDDEPAETVLYSDNFDVDSTANWIQAFASETNQQYDASFTFAYDYSTLGIPSAPHSAGDTHGLMMTVNKANAQAAGINFYPVGQSFSNDFALRFDMYLIMGSGSFTTEYAMFGINHSGLLTNWFRNTGAGVVGGYAFDGIWSYVEADGAALGDYVLNSAPAITNAGVVGPTTLASRLASTLTQTFHTPPWTVGAGSGGAPANLDGSLTPSWAQVEISQIGKLVTLRINKTVIFSITNNTAFTNGNIMLGYDDAYDSIGPAGASVIYDNVRVVQVSSMTIASQPTNVVAGVGTNVTFAIGINPTTTGITNYQWLFNGNPIAGATSNPLTFGVLPSSFGNYSVRFDDGDYTNVSSVVTLKPPLPIINTNPASRVTLVNTATNLSVVATTYSGVTNYQWYFTNNVAINPVTPLTGTTTNPFNLTVRSTNYGAYKVVVSDGQGQSVTSSVVTITPPLPLIITQPVSRAAVVGSSPSFSVLASTSSGITNYQWFYYGTNLPGATAATLTLNGVQPISFGGPYTVRVSDGTTSVTSAPPATLTVAVSPSITAPAQIGSSFRLSFTTEVGPAYVVDFKPTLGAPTWTPLKTNAGTGGIINFTNTPAGDQGYYRIRLQ